MGFWGVFLLPGLSVCLRSLFSQRFLCSSNQVWRSLLEFRSGRLRVVRGFFDSRVHRY